MSNPFLMCCILRSALSDCVKLLTYKVKGYCKYRKENALVRFVPEILKVACIDIENEKAHRYITDVIFILLHAIVGERYECDGVEQCPIPKLPLSYHFLCIIIGISTKYR